MTHWLILSNDTVIIFGRSPFVNEIRSEIPKLCRKFFSIGCNYFVESFPCVNAVIFYDDITPRFFNNQLLITQRKYAEDAEYKCHELCRTHKHSEFYDVKRTPDGLSGDPGKLNFWFHTPSMALNWAHQKGYSRAILAGIDLDIGTPHFDDGSVPEWEINGLLDARSQFERLCVEFGEVLQLNPECTLDIAKASCSDFCSEQ